MSDCNREDAWRVYQRQSDRPTWFTRWMLSRTLDVLDEHAGAGSPVVADTSARTLDAAHRALEQALRSKPLQPPTPVDSRVDLLWLRLSVAEAQLVVEQFLAAEGVSSGVALDTLQLKRKNPWGGFREAWLEHYNYCLKWAQGSDDMAERDVQSEVAGSVWKVHVAAGDKVSRDQELMILESMKMEIPVDAPCDGTVVSVLVEPQDGVEEDQVLLILES